MLHHGYTSRISRASRAILLCMKQQRVYVSHVITGGKLPCPKGFHTSSDVGGDGMILDDVRKPCNCENWCVNCAEMMLEDKELEKAI